jgi:uncharacterized protein
VQPAPGENRPVLTEQPPDARLWHDVRPTASTPHPKHMRPPGVPLARTLRPGTRARRQTGVVRITVRVRPGSARPGVGGEHDGALIVRVNARAVDGQATTAALAAVAAAFGVRRQAVTLVAGASSRTKIVDVAGADPAVLDRLLGR